MEFLKIPFSIKHMPPLDPGFVPISAFSRAYRAMAKQPLAIAVERENGQRYVYLTHIIGEEAYAESDCFYVERMVKLLLWAIGGFRVTISGSQWIADHIKRMYSADGQRAFDAEFMARVYERPFEVLSTSYEDRPAFHEVSASFKRSLNGCRIGFDAGGSDRKVSAVIDGEAVYSEEKVWHPKVTADPIYHYNEIVEAFRTAASKMPRVDAIGVSSAGIYVANRTMVASLFLKVPQDDFDRVAKDIYIDAAKAIGDVPLVVANDGDVTALAGAMDLEDTQVLGIAMGTSMAAGYIDKNGNITGRLNELAFAPVDGKGDGAVDEWSGDKGCGVKCMSQDAVALLAPQAGIQLPEGTPAEKLKYVQALMTDGNAAARTVYKSIGCYLGHALPLYREIYDCKHVLLLGRVMSGEGGQVIMEQAQQVLHDDYPEIQNLQLHLPDEKSRRVGQSVAAAALPVL